MALRDLLDQAREIEGYLTEIRRRIHANPELGFQETKTTSLIREEISRLGLKIQPLKLETGVGASLKGRAAGPETVTALRADMDALPITESTGLSYASKNKGIMHACGHDGHVSLLLGAARLLSGLTDRFSGTVKFLFQPAEELLTGARAMIEAGCLRDPVPERIIAAHGWPYIKTGKIGVLTGPAMASADKFQVRLKGRGGHGAYPHRAVDPVLAAAHTVTAMQGIISRETDPLDQAVLSVCTMEAGRAFNVIPGEALLGGTVRCIREGLQKEIRSRLERVVKGTAAAFGCEGSLEWTGLVPVLVNDPELTRTVEETAREVLGREGVEKLAGPSMGSEDFSLYLQEVPRGVLFRLGLAVPEKNMTPLHNDQFDFTDPALPVGAAMMAGLVLKIHR
jgi:amidohydrolase